MDFTRKEEELLKFILNNIVRDSELAKKLRISEEEVKKIKNELGKKLKEDLRKKVEKHYK